MKFPRYVIRLAKPPAV